MFQTGDRVVSDRYGPGIVTGKSAAETGVKVDFKGGPMDNVYHAMTGQRHPKCGTDKIVSVEDKINQLEEMIAKGDELAQLGYDTGMLNMVNRELLKKMKEET